MRHYLLVLTRVAVPTEGRGWHMLVNRCVKAIEAEIKHQTASKRKTLNLSCCSCLKDIVKRAARQLGACSTISAGMSRR